MYVRLTSRRFPTAVIKTENEYTISEDKSCALIKGSIEDGKLVVGSVTANRHAIHVYRNPELGGSSFQIITQDDGPVKLNTKISKTAADKAEDLDYHYKLFLVRVDVPFVY